MHLIIRADGGPEIGYGHLVRTGALAYKFLQQNHSITYATTTPEYVKDVCPSGVEIVNLPSRTDVSPFVECIGEGVDVALIDSYCADGTYQRSVREKVPLVVVSDDARHPICADTVINGNLYASDLDYRVFGEEPTWYLGPDYLLLRESIAILATRNPPWREKPERALVTMGGSDVANLTPSVIQAFDGLELFVEAIVGPGFSEDQERKIRNAAIEA
jgi:spore coat polysaccharide biosynthesis predicted glycosyltransferase SpsG